MSHLKKEELEDFCLYKCEARNFSIGIWFNGKMHGLRRKFGDEYVDTEYHWDDENYGTCRPLKKISSSLKERLHPSMFDVSNWRGQSVLHDVLFTAEAISEVFNEDDWRDHVFDDVPEDGTCKEA